MDINDLDEITEDEIKDKRMQLSKWFVKNRHLATIDGTDGTAIMRLLHQTGFFSSHNWERGMFLRDTTRAIVNAIRIAALETPLDPEDIKEVDIHIEDDGDGDLVACVLST